MKRVYIVTDGEYSDYHIEKVFTDPVKARLCQMLLCPDYGRVEIYDVDDVEITVNSNWIRVIYYVNSDYIDKIEVSDAGEYESISYEYGGVYYTFSINLTNKRLYSNVIKYGMGSKMLLKIAQDKFAQWAYEHDTNKEELLEEAKQKLNRSYGFDIVTAYTTSAGFPEQKTVNVLVDERLRELLKNEQSLPDNLEPMINAAKEENNG